MRAYLIGHLNKFVGGLTHGGNDPHDTMTAAMQIGETARDRADFCRCFKTGAAVFLHDDGILAHSTYKKYLESGRHPSANELRHPRLQAFRNTNAMAVHARPAPFGHRLTRGYE